MTYPNACGGCGKYSLAVRPFKRSRHGSIVSNGEGTFSREACPAKVYDAVGSRRHLRRKLLLRRAFRLGRQALRRLCFGVYGVEHRGISQCKNYPLKK